MKPYGFVYIHTCRPTGKVYVGKTIQKESRRYRNGKGYKSCIYFQAAINKYGWENFDHEILEYGSNAAELKALEEKYFRKYESTNPEKGFNLKDISEGHEYLTQEIKDKIGKAQLDHNQKLREAGIVKIAPNRKEYKIINEVTLKHCAHKDHWVPIQDFGADSSKWDKLCQHCRVCHKEQTRKSKDKNLLSEEEMIQSRKDRLPAQSAGLKQFHLENPGFNKGMNSKAIKRIDMLTGEIKFYKSALEAKADGFSNTLISQCCNGKRLMYRGYKWQFVK